MAGKKHDEGKLDWHALPLELVELLVPVAVAGAKKYGRGNILEPFDEADRRFYSATMRHVRACQHNPLAVDEETGCYHAAQAAYDLLARVYQCELMTAEHGGYSLHPLDDGDDWGGGKGQCSLERESQIVAEEVRAFGEQLAAKLNNTVLCHGCGLKCSIGSEQEQSVNLTGRCTLCIAEKERETYTVPPLDDRDDDPAVHVVPDRTSRSGEVDASDWRPCPND